MVYSFLCAVVCRPVNIERQAGYGFRQDANAGIYRGGLHGRSFIDGFAAGGSAEEKAVCAAIQTILGLARALIILIILYFHKTPSQNGMKRQPEECLCKYCLAVVLLPGIDSLAFKSAIKKQSAFFFTNT